VRGEIARLDLGLRRRSVVGYTFGLALYAFVVVALYPAFEHSSSLDSFVKSDSTAAALFGVSGRLSSSGGWLNGNIYANFFPLIALLTTIGYGAGAIAGQDEDGTLCLIATLPVPRPTIVAHKIAAMTIQAAVLAAAVALCVLIGRSFRLDVGLEETLAVSAAVLLMALDFGLLAMAIGGLTGRRATAIGVSAAAAAASYLLSSLAPVVSWLHPARYASLFFWAVGNNQIVSGVSLADYAVLLAVAALAGWGAIAAFQRLDVH
jgi:beta-exotoxin I transport system permease protein